MFYASPAVLFITGIIRCGVITIVQAGILYHSSPFEKACKSPLFEQAVSHSSAVLVLGTRSLIPSQQPKYLIQRKSQCFVFSMVRKCKELQFHIQKFLVEIIMKNKYMKYTIKQYTKPGIGRINMSRLYNVERFKFRRLSSSKRLSFSFQPFLRFCICIIFLSLCA